MKALSKSLVTPFTLKNCTFSFCSFSSTTKEAYNTIQKQKEYLNSLGKELNINSYEDWYRISTSSFGPLYFKYPSILNLLQTIYPNYIWSTWKFNNSPPGCWDIKYNRRQHFDDISKNLNLAQTNDWYKITVKQTYQSGHSSLLARYKTNLFLTLNDLYPEINWIPWNFLNLPSGFWDSVQNQKDYCKNLEKKFNIKSVKDWYSFGSKNIGPLYSKYNSTYHLLKSNYPEYIWQPWLFKYAPTRCWFGLPGKYNRRQYFNHISKLLNITSQKEWYSKTANDLFQIESVSFLSIRYNSNLFYCLVDLYPEINWILWKQPSVPKKFWENYQNILQFLNWCEKENNMKSKNDWYYITYPKFRNLGGNSLLVKWKGLYNILNHFFPNENWDKSKFKSLDKGGKSQHRVASLIQDLICDEIVFENYKHSNIYFKNTKKKIELDIFIPSLNIAFEYQGKQHYENNTLHQDTKDIKERDLEKKELCLNNSITLIEIPFTWDQKKSSLKKIINSIRPDILK